MTAGDALPLAIYMAVVVLAFAAYFGLAYALAAVFHRLGDWIGARLRARRR